MTRLINLEPARSCRKLCVKHFASEGSSAHRSSIAGNRNEIVLGNTIADPKKGDTAWHWNWLEAEWSKIKEIQRSGLHQTRSTEQQPRFLREKNASKFTKLIGFIGVQVQCREAALDEQKRKGEYMASGTSWNEIDWESLNVSEQRTMKMFLQSAQS